VTIDASATVVFSLKDNIGLGVAELSAEKIKVYSNPTRGKINIQIPNDSRYNTVGITVYNILGQQLYTANKMSEDLVGGAIQLDLRGRVSAGQVVFVTVSIDHQTSTFKVVIKK